MPTSTRFQLASIRSIVVAITILSFMSLSCAPTTAQTRNQAVVFAVTSEGDEASMDAVVIVNGARLQRPYNDEQERPREAFGKKYFAAGKIYRLIFGGGELGSVKVKSWDTGCNNIHAKATATTSARLGGKVMALATDSTVLVKRPSTRRAPTETERAATLTLMKSIYRQHRTPANLISSITVTNLTATDLDGDGTYEMIGSFTLAAKNKFERDLFLIAKAQGNAMKADFAKFQAYQPPAEGFLWSIDFVDQLDLDGNGVGEVFATQGGFDGYSYVIFKKVAGRWRQVFDFVGDAC